MHQKNETLFWTKIASILDLPQQPLVHSMVPMPAGEARRSLRVFLEGNNVNCTEETFKSKDALLDSFGTLAKIYGPRFIEKSPHHLRNWSNIELILANRERCRDEVDINIVGLVRNPYGVIYSAWSRWKFDPIAFEAEWYESYHNLLRLKGQLGEQLTLFRYEDLTKNNRLIDKYVGTIGAFEQSTSDVFIHNHSVSKYQQDKKFGHQLSKKTMELAQQIGYSIDELTNTKHWTWPGRRTYHKFKHYTKDEIRTLLKNRNK
ncbi:hypothetical protein [Lewinella sp. IMCC34191]|uniref:hypothetical protein n=1 Tax=Lewinella sp. IMCC34191 TaxID=2259172 RepID=UPI000E26A1FE|nr:hypothetical protein [Lewinella sp. IMCC34191]